MKNVGYVWERVYPYVIALVSVMASYFGNFNMMMDADFKELLNGLVTLDSIIIGFLGAIMPVILSMKNESKFVKYVFEKDKENLFCKYIKITVLLGICNVIVTLVLHVKLVISEKWRMYIYYAWVWMAIAFLVATYRSMSHMISLIFSRDSEVSEDIIQNSISEDRIQELKNKYKGN